MILFSTVWLITYTYIVPVCLNTGDYVGVVQTSLCLSLCEHKLLVLSKGPVTYKRKFLDEKEFLFIWFTALHSFQQLTFQLDHGC